MSKNVGRELSKKHKSARIQQIFHDSMRIVLHPLKEAGKEGMEVTFGDGYVRKVYPILACYVADYPEQCLVTCAKYGTCPKCLVSENELGQRKPGKRRSQKTTLGVIQDSSRDATSFVAFQERCKTHKISGSVTKPFWEGFPLCDIHLSITPDVLHQLYQGVLKHLIHWCTSLIAEKELDARIQCLPPCFGVRHFKNGWSQLSQVSGKERKDMAKILLGCLVGKAPSQVILCYRAILDFIYIAQYSSHDDETLKYLEESLDLFHANKQVLTDPNLLKLRKHLNIPKFHSMLHYAQAIRNFGTTDNYNTEMFERFHIDCAKDAWRASNFKDELPQMVQWLSRQEKVAMFETYLEHYESVEDIEFESIAGSPAGPQAGISLSKRPSVPNQSLLDIQSKHHCPSFSLQLIIYLNQLLDAGQRIPRSGLANAQLPFNKLPVWHAFKLGRDALGNDVDPKEELDAIKARPKRGKEGIERFDPVVVAYSDEAESTGLHGESNLKSCDCRY